MAEYTELEKNYLEHEGTSIDSLMLYRELKAVKNELSEVKSNTDTTRTKKADILAIKDSNKRLKAISENIELFADMFPGGTK